jgi:hypothetical protein
MLRLNIFKFLILNIFFVRPHPYGEGCGYVPGLEIINFSTLSIVTLSKSNQLGPYLAGLIEGDGSIIVPNKPNLLAEH